MTQLVSKDELSRIKKGIMSTCSNIDDKKAVKSHKKCRKTRGYIKVSK